MFRRKRYPAVQSQFSNIWHAHWHRVAKRMGMTRDELIDHLGNGGTIE